MKKLENRLFRLFLVHGLYGYFLSLIQDSFYVFTK